MQHETALNLCRAIESRWKRSCPSLPLAETEVILWRRSFKNCTVNSLIGLESFQSNRLEHVRLWQRGVLCLFSGRRHLSCSASWGCRGRNVGVYQRGSDCNVPCEGQSSLWRYQRQTIRAFAVTTTETTRFIVTGILAEANAREMMSLRTWCFVIRLGAILHTKAWRPHVSTLWPTPTGMCSAETQTEP